MLGYLPMGVLRLLRLCKCRPSFYLDVVRRRKTLEEESEGKTRRVE